MIKDLATKHQTEKWNIDNFLKFALGEKTIKPQKPKSLYAHDESNLMIVSDHPVKKSPYMDSE